MRNRPLNFFSFALFATAFFYAGHGARPLPQALEPSGLAAACGPGAREYTGRLRSRVLIHHGLNGGAPSRERIEDSVREQLAFVRGLYSNYYKETGQQAAFALGWKKLTVLKSEDVPYGADLEIDTPAVYPEVPAKDYVDRARAAGKVSSGDPATSVEYEAELEVLGCSELDDIQARLPLDPYLAYWSVRPEARRKMVWRSSAAVVNPCADSELADLPSPEYFWYFYNPYAAGCSPVNGTLALGPLQFHEEGRLPNQITLNAGALAKLPEIRISLVFGYIVHDERYGAPSEVAEALRVNGESEDARYAHWDTSTKQFLWFWNRLHERAEITGAEFEPNGTYLMVRAKGRLRAAGGKPFALTAYLGPTDLYGPVPPRHWAETLRGMLEDHVFIYMGHSGLGENLRLSRIVDQALPLARPPDPPEYQILAYISCYSYTYFDQGLFPSLPGASPRKSADLFLTGGMTYDFGTMTDAVFGTLSAALVNGGKADLAAFFPKSDFVIHRRFTPPGERSVASHE